MAILDRDMREASLQSYRDEDSDTDPVSDASDTSWIYWTILAVGLFLLVFIIVLLWDIIARFRSKMTNPPMFDGGPPATPTHSFTYKVAVKADAASATFDLSAAMIRVELLDSLNRYITSIVVPCFLLKFKDFDTKSSNLAQEPAHTPAQPGSPSGNPSAPETTPTSSGVTPPSATPSPAVQSTIKEQHTSERRTPSVPFIYIKTMTILQEQWAHTPHGELVSFDLTKRYQLQDVRSARVLHDCYLEDAIITLKYFVIYDPIAKINWMVDLKNKPLRAVHPCPASGFQVYPVEKVQQHEDLKSFVELSRPKHFSWCPSFLRFSKPVTT